MTTFTPELEAGARAMYERHREGSKAYFNRRWEALLPNEQHHACQAFAAGIEAFASALPVEGAAGVTRGFIRHITGRDA